MSQATPRQRVWQAIRHQQRDRVPWHFSYTTPAREKLQRHFGTADLDAVLGNPPRAKRRKRPPRNCRPEWLHHRAARQSENPDPNPPGQVRGDLLRSTGQGPDGQNPGRSPGAIVPRLFFATGVNGPARPESIRGTPRRIARRPMIEAFPANPPIFAQLRGLPDAQGHHRPAFSRRRPDDLIRTLGPLHANP